MNILMQRLKKCILVLALLCIVVIVIFAIIYQEKIEKHKMPPVAQVHITSDFMKDYELQWGDGYVDASIRIEDGEHDVIEDVGRIKLRGNSTLEADKLSYAYKFDANVDVLGMGEGKKWVLLANAFDPTLMRNYIALYFADKLKLNYTSECRYVDLWINDKYQGNYLMTEPVQDGENRVDIHPAAGDFLVEYEKYRDDEDDTSYILTENGYRYLIHDPKHASEMQAEYVLDTMNQVEQVINKVYNSSDGTDDVIDILSEVIDIDSFVDYCIFNEFIKSADMGFSSEYYYYKDGKIYAGPVWDYDLSAGNANSSYYIHYSNLATTGDSTQGLWISDQGKLLKELMDCKEFEDLVWKRYCDSDVQNIITDIYEDDGLIDEMLKAYGESYESNYKDAGWEEATQYFAYAGTPLPTFEENVEYLRQWYKRRNEWLIENIGR